MGEHLQVISLGLCLCLTWEYSLQATSSLQVVWRRVMCLSPAEEDPFGCCRDRAAPWVQLVSSQRRAHHDTGPSLTHQHSVSHGRGQMSITISAFACHKLQRPVQVLCDGKERGAQHLAHNPAVKPHLTTPVCARLPPISSWEAICFMLISEQTYSLCLLLFASLDLKLL